MDKTLGQVAYEAYAKHRFGYDPDDATWDGEPGHDAWQAVAEAVAGSVDVREGDTLWYPFGTEAPSKQLTMLAIAADVMKMERKAQ